MDLLCKGTCSDNVLRSAVIGWFRPTHASWVLRKRWQNKFFLDSCLEVRWYLLALPLVCSHSRLSGTGKHIEAETKWLPCPGDIFKCILLNENVWIPIKFSLHFVPKSPMNNVPTLVQIMAWRRPGDKPLSEPMMVSLLMHICVTQLQRVKGHWLWILQHARCWNIHDRSFVRTTMIMLSSSKSLPVTINSQDLKKNYTLNSFW